MWQYKIWKYIKIVKVLNKLLTLCAQRVQPSFHNVGSKESPRLRMRVILDNDITSVALFFVVFS